MYVVILEALSRMVSATMDKGLLLGFSMESSDNVELLVSHLLFVDDTMIFCEANLDHLYNLHYIFLCFKVVSELKINLAKSELVLVGVVEDVGGL
jgi:hypothetical protein